MKDRKPLKRNEKAELARMIQLLEMGIYNDLDELGMFELITILSSGYAGVLEKEEWISLYKKHIRTAIVEMTNLINAWNYIRNGIIRQRNLEGIKCTKEIKMLNPWSKAKRAGNKFSDLALKFIKRLGSESGFNYGIDFKNSHLQYHFELIKAFALKTQGLAFDQFQFCGYTKCRRLFFKTRPEKVFCRTQCKDREKEYQLVRDPLKRGKYERKLKRQMDQRRL